MSAPMFTSDLLLFLPFEPDHFIHLFHKYFLNEKVKLDIVLGISRQGLSKSNR